MSRRVGSAGHALTLADAFAAVATGLLMSVPAYLLYLFGWLVPWHVAVLMLLAAMSVLMDAVATGHDASRQRRLVSVWGLAGLTLGACTVLLQIMT